MMLPRSNKAASCKSLTSMAWAVSILALAAPHAIAQPIELSSIEAGSGPGFALLGRGAGEAAGQVVSKAGDVNGDGIGDFLVSAPTSATPTGRSSGVAYVVFGSTSTAPLELSALETQSSPRGFAILGHRIGDRTGIALAAAGDVNGDGLGDVVIGADFSSVGGVNAVGRAFVVFGRTGNSAVWLSDVASGSSGAGFVLNGEKPMGELGAFVAGLGDVNGDGLADVAVACRRWTPGWSGPSSQLRAYVVFGRTATTALDLSSLATGSSAAGFVIRRTEPSETIALSGAGDVNGDGLGDIAWMSTSYSLLASVAVVWGRTTTPIVEWSSLNGVSNGFRLSVSTTINAPRGTVAGAGDVNGDGFADLVVGQPRFSSTGTTPVNTAGQAFVQFGGTGTPSSAARFVINAEGTADRLGASVAGAGDVNGDGLSDVIVGATGVDPATGTDAGRSYVVFGKTSTTAVAASDVVAGTGGFAINGTAPADQSGTAVGGGTDMTGDGRPDVLVGTARDLYPTFAQRGIAYALHTSVVPAASGTATARIRAGNAPRWGIGATNQGTDASNWVDSRAWVDFDAGSATSTTSATITRNKDGVAGIAPETIANARWSLTTQRTAYGNARLTLRYTDAEIAGLAEGNLALLSAADLAGPWQPLAAPQVDMARNEVSGTTTALGAAPLHVVIADVGAPQPTPTPTPTPTPAPTPIPGPANDNFAAATVVTTSATGNNTGATREVGEPFHASDLDSGSIWFRWTATANGPVRVSTCGSTLDTILAVYTGASIDGLTRVARNDQSPYCPDIFDQSMVGFVAEAGTTYHIAVCGFLEKAGPVTVNVETGNAVPPRPANDDFASAKVLVTSVLGNNVGSTREVAEPEHHKIDDSGSVWYRYTATTNEPINITTDGSSFDTVMAVYQGNALGALSLVAANDTPPVGGLDTDAEVTFVPQPGATYHIAVAGFLGQTGALKVAVRLASQVPVPPPNDDFAKAATLVTTATGSNVNATLEYNEIVHHNIQTSGTVWYKWRAPSVGSTVTIDTCGSDFDTVMGVYYQGPNSPYYFNRLVLVGSSDDGGCPASPAASSVTFSAPALRTYYIAVGGFPPATGNVVVNATINTVAANGDANYDGVINVVDLTRIHNFVANIDTSTIPGDGDVDNNGSITINDATLLREYIVNGVALP